MSQIESLIMVVVIGFIASSIVAYLPNKVSIFHSSGGKNFFGLAVSMLLANLWPILSDEILINRHGKAMYPLFGYLTLVGFVFFTALACKAERKENSNE